MVIFRSCSPSKEPEWHVSKIACSIGIRLKLKVMNLDKERTTRVLPWGKGSTRYFLNSWTKLSQRKMKVKFGKNYIVNQIVAISRYESYATVEINGIEYAHKKFVTPSSIPSSSVPVLFVSCVEWPETACRMVRFSYDQLDNTHNERWNGLPAERPSQACGSLSTRDHDVINHLIYHVMQ